MHTVTPARPRRLPVAGAAVTVLLLALTGCTGPDAADGGAASPAPSATGEPDGATDEGAGDEATDGDAGATADEVAVSREVAHDGGTLRMDVAPVERGGDLARMTVTVTAVENPPEEETWFFYSVFSLTQTRADDFQLVDLENQQRYLVARDEAGDCVCTGDINGMGLAEGESARIEATFAAPPEDVDTIDVVLPGVAGTFGDVPVR